MVFAAVLELEPRTMFFVLGAGSLVMAIALSVANQRGAHLRAMTFWAVGNALQFVAWLLYALRGVIPNTTSFTVPFVALSAGVAAQLIAIVTFSGRRASPWIIGGCFAVGVAVHTASALLAPANQQWRIAFASIDMAGWETACVIALVTLAAPRERVSYWMTGAFFALAAATSLYRGLGNIVGTNPTVSLLSVNVAQSLTFGTAYIMLLGTSLGFILMAKERADHEILRVAATDSLTGLLNRRTFEEAARNELARTSRTGTPMCALMCDLDHFKEVNDTYGHPVGDLVLANFARVLRDGLRPFDIVSRYGGEEFFVLLPETNLEDALAIAERIRIATSESSVKAGEGALIGITVSIGVTQVKWPGATLEAIVKGADLALYAAKAAGRNSVRAM